MKLGRRATEGKPRREAPMEVGAPASGIEVASSAKALTPRRKDLEAGTWAETSFPHAARCSVADESGGLKGHDFCRPVGTWRGFASGSRGFTPGYSRSPRWGCDDDAGLHHFDPIGVVSQYVPFVAKVVNTNPGGSLGYSMDNSGSSVVEPMDFVLERLRAFQKRHCHRAV